MTAKASALQIVAACAVIGCAAFGFVTLLTIGRAQELQAKLKQAEQELEIVRKLPGYRQLLSVTARMRQQNPEVYKQAQQQLERMPQQRKKSQEADVKERLAKVQERLKTTHAGGEILVLKQMTNVLTVLEELETAIGDGLSLAPEEMFAPMTERFRANEALVKLREQYLQVRLQMAAEELGYTDSATTERFVSAVEKILADTDAMTIPRWARQQFESKGESGKLKN